MRFATTLCKILYSCSFRDEQQNVPPSLSVITCKNIHSTHALSFTTVKDTVLAGGNQNSVATEVALNSINIFPLARHGRWLSLSYHLLSSLSISLSS